MHKTTAGAGVLNLISAPIQEVPASLVLTFAALTLLLSTVLTVLCLHQPGPSVHNAKPLATVLFY